MSTVRELASQMYNAFEQATRTDETSYYRLRDGSPEWMQDVCFAAHGKGDMLPDDYRYEFIHDAVSAIDDLNSDEDNNIEDVRDSLQASIYNHELLDWLSSHGNRHGYLDEAMEEYGMTATNFAEVITAIQAAQLKEMTEVFELVLEKLTELADDAEGE